MNWIAIVLAGLIGGLSALFAGLIVRDRANQRGKYALVTGAIFIALQALSSQSLLPALNTLKAKHDAHRALQETPAFVQLKLHEPRSYDEMEAELARAIQRGEPVSQATARVRESLLPVLIKYIPYCSDETLKKYFSVVVRGLDEARGKNPEVAYALIFPKKDESVNVAQYASEQTNQDLMSVLTDVLRTGADRSSQAYDPERAKVAAGSILEKERIFERLREKLGDKALLLSNLQAPGLDKATVCEVISAFLHEVLALPSEECKVVLRSMAVLSATP